MLHRIDEAPGDLQMPSPLEIARLVVALLVAVLLQTTIAPQLRILGAHPDFALVVLVCVALLKGAEIGAIFGFLTGSLTAIALMEPVGVAAFIFVLVGYYVGRYAETAEPTAGFAHLLAAFAATFAEMVLLAIAQALLERPVSIGYFVVRVLAPSLILNTLLAGPVFLVVRWWLREGGDARAIRARERRRPTSS